MMEYVSITDADIVDLEKYFGGEWSFDEKRRNTLINHDDVQACPGSGKTTLVSAKLILLANKWRETHKGICVLTHTNVAKEEILQRLQKHPSGHKLLSYPHFIGTIQEFVNKFLGIPYCRSCERSIVVIDDRKCVEILERSLGYKTRKFLEHRPGASLYDFKILFDGSELNYKVPGFPKPSPSESYRDLSTQKDALLDNGFYYFREMYAFAEKLLQENSDLKSILRNRFPFVFIDEMQDTQKFQDDLLNSIFCCDEVVFQRFGDPDQAIFDGMSGEKSNESYNNNTALVPIEDSHRFGNDIALIIKGLSYNKLANLGSIRNPSEGNGIHTVFLYDDQTIKTVLPKFGNLVYDSLKIDSMTDEQRKKVMVKAVGSVGRENPNGLTLKTYWEGYDKSKSRNSFRANKLIHIVKKCSEQEEGDVSDNYGLLLQGILDFLRKADKKFRNQEGDEVYYSKSTLRKELQATRKIGNFKRLLTSWLISDFPDRDIWNSQLNSLKSLLDLNYQINSNAQDFVGYDPYTPVDSETKEGLIATNIYKCSNGINIEVATIHAVKGETHDATLILETKFGYFCDLQSLLNFFIDDSKDRPIGNHDKPRSKSSLEVAFLKRLYVAASRPRHLLCLAINKNHVSPEQIEALGTKGWMISDLSE